MANRTYVNITAKAAHQLGQLFAEVELKRQVVKAADLVAQSKLADAHHYVHLTQDLSFRISKTGD